MSNKPPSLIHLLLLSAALLCFLCPSSSYGFPPGQDESALPVGGDGCEPECGPVLRLAVDQDDFKGSDDDVANSSTLTDTGIIASSLEASEREKLQGDAHIQRAQLQAWKMLQSMRCDPDRKDSDRVALLAQLYLQVAADLSKAQEQAERMPCGGPQPGDESDGTSLDELDPGYQPDPVGHDASQVGSNSGPSSTTQQHPTQPSQGVEKSGRPSETQTSSPTSPQPGKDETRPTSHQPFQQVQKVSPPPSRTQSPSSASSPAGKRGATSSKKKKKKKATGGRRRLRFW
ncbi:hypothetical protein XA68_15306 [Ophiocordyceps unilateralis]|uniref:Uncharacterized protein n=1 Tax=Ophiocordyceps unilateralis TaxID=268505 RepID=A0A2A9P8P2_OPHUN|nr:hypothetical protein XA68_15306 [Ophiocordyceps unilateralis]